MDMPQGPVAAGWMTTAVAATLTGYTPAYLRRLSSQGRIRAQKVGRDWLLHRESLLAYHKQMQRLGRQRHNPWRDDLREQGRGRQPKADQTEEGEHHHDT
jgi:excisionase family DNA binding protein